MKHNWEYKRLGDVCRILMGQSPSSDSYNEAAKGLPFFQGCSDFGKIHPTVSKYCSEPIRVAAENDILFSVRAPIGTMNIANQPCCIGRGLCSFKINEPNFQKYLFYALNVTKPKIIEKGTGSTFKAVGKDVLHNHIIPVPPREVQERIVAELDKINEVIEDCRELLRKLDALAQSLFYDYFGDPVTNPKGWEMMFLKDILNKIGSGATPKGGKESYLGGNVSLIRSLNVYNTYFKYEELAKINDKQAYELRNVEVKNDDVLLNITGASVARCFIAPTDTLPARVNQHVAILRPKSQFLQSIYLHRLIIATSFQNELITISRGKNATREALPKAIIEKIAIPVPPLVLQEEFAERIERIEAQKKAVEQTIAELQTLLNSRMDYWFN